MLKIVLEAEVLLVEYDRAAKVFDVDGYMVDALEHRVLLSGRIASEWAGLQASEKAPAGE
jgi:hypothetical protein